MKYCPGCQSQYTDDTLRFCLQDGTRLRSGQPSPLPTAEPGEQETLVAGGRTNPDALPAANKINWPKQPAPTAFEVAPPNESSSILTLLLAALVVSLFLGLIGIGGYLYFRSGKFARGENILLAEKSPVADLNNTGANSSSNRTNTAATPASSRTPVATTANPKVPVDKEQIKKVVSGRIFDWKANAEARNLDAYMESYAETVDYYRKKGASIAFVRADKQRAFTAYDTIKINISNMSITPDAKGEKATATFDKEWVFHGLKYSAGKVRTLLQLKKVDSRWLITAERDLRVYRAEK